jgi:quercetin dioxygenase-like cupin family protein
LAPGISGRKGAFMEEAKQNRLNKSVSLTLFSFDQGEEISAHSSDGDAMVTVLDGTGKFTVGDEVFILKKGETLIMPNQVSHAVYGEEQFKMLLTVVF